MRPGSQFDTESDFYFMPAPSSEGGSSSSGEDLIIPDPLGDRLDTEWAASQERICSAFERPAADLPGEEAGRQAWQRLLGALRLDAITAVFGLRRAAPRLDEFERIRFAEYDVDPVAERVSVELIVELTERVRLCCLRRRPKRTVRNVVDICRVVKWKMINEEAYTPKCSYIGIANVGGNYG